ncbi:MAG: helix-turn-helix domain-containing protein [Geminicoccaceae bacterium]
MATKYRYTECGLDNVIIVNMDVVKDDAGEVVYMLPNINGLHKVIAYGILAQHFGMSPTELRYLRSEIGMTQGELARLVKKDHQTIGRWERGEKPIDQNAEAIIRRIAADRLEIDIALSMEELAMRCVPTDDFHQIIVDGSDPENYKLAA